MPPIAPPDTIRRDGDAVVILDQAVLPHRREFRHLACLEEAAAAIRDMQVRGAPLIGVTAAFGVALALQREAGDERLAQALAILGATRPTAVNLHWALRRMQAVLSRLPPAERARAAWDEAEAIRAGDAGTCAAIGANGLALLRQAAGPRDGKPVRVMTHCNAGRLATAGTGTALAPVYAAQAAGVPVEVWVSETRPRNQGLLTAWELREAGIPHRLIADNAAGLLLSRGDVDLVITGADRIAANGDSANKIGTLLKALAARDCGVPFYIAAPVSTIDFACPRGDAIPIEDRGPAEVRLVEGLDEEGRLKQLRLAPPETDALNPAFDVTPARLITAIVTEHGIHAPGALGALHAEHAP